MTTTDQLRDRLNAAGVILRNLQSHIDTLVFSQMGGTEADKVIRATEVALLTAQAARHVVEILAGAEDEGLVPVVRDMMKTLQGSLEDSQQPFFYTGGTVDKETHIVLEAPVSRVTPEQYAALSHRSPFFAPHEVSE